MIMIAIMTILMVVVAIVIGDYLKLDLDSSQVWSGALQSLNSPSKKLMIYQIYHDLPGISG